MSELRELFNRYKRTFEDYLAAKLTLISGRQIADLGADLVKLEAQIDDALTKMEDREKENADVTT